jgi:hypothetical protein
MVKKNAQIGKFNTIKNPFRKAEVTANRTSLCFCFELELESLDLIIVLALDLNSLLTVTKVDVDINKNGNIVELNKSIQSTILNFLLFEHW